MNKTELHPCFNLKAKLKYARVHLPVAPKCNVQCKYCNRKYDCVNESRPGITSAVLSPYQAVNYLKKISEKVPNISTIGIAGPGDAFAEPEKTLETIRLIKSEYPEKIFCLSTNGLEVAKYVKELAALDVTHVTLTINSLRTETLQKVYNWVRFNKKVYRGLDAARVMKEQQMKALEALKEYDITVKVNTIIMPGINDDEMEEVARMVAAKGANTMNCIPLIPAEGSDMENASPPTAQSIIRIHKGIAKYIQPMTHCARCRADAAGKIGHDEPDAMRVLHECTLMPTPAAADKPFVAVASYEGLLINRHMGETDSFLIFKQEGDGYKQLGRRKSATKGKGDLRWIELSRILKDCRYVLVNGVGAKPVEILQRVGIGVVEMSGLITDGLDAVYKGKKLKAVIKTSTPKCGEACSGNGMGCG